MAPDGTLTHERGERSLAPGERVMFLKNDRELGVKNGTLGSVLEIDREHLRVKLDGREGREVDFQLNDYAALDYGYAATVHKAQGATVERSFVLATPGMDRHLAYVGMTRHREGVELFAGRDDFRGFHGAQGAAAAGPGSRTSRWITRTAAGSNSTAKARPMNGGWKPSANSIARPKSSESIRNWASDGIRCRQREQRERTIKVYRARP